MALEESDKLELRESWLRDMLHVAKANSQGVKTVQIAELKSMLRNAEADRIALTDPAAADVHRKLIPEWS